MSNEFIDKNVKEIIQNKAYKEPLNYAMACAWICGNFKGINLKVLDMQNKSSLGDYFIIASATNNSQASAIGEEIVKQMKQNGLNILSKEGLNSGADWLLIDLGDFIVHIFQETARAVYDLDTLWNAPSIEIPNEYYYSSDFEEKKEDNSPKGYF